MAYNIASLTTSTPLRIGQIMSDSEFTELCDLLRSLKVKCNGVVLPSVYDAVQCVYMPRLWCCT